MTKTTFSRFWLLAVFFWACQTTKNSDHIARGNQYARDGLYREAATSYKKAISLDPQNDTAYRNLGMVLVKLGDFKNAIKHLEKSMSLYKNNFEANFYIGEAFRAEENYAKAIFHYQRALEIRENDQKTLKALAWSFFKIRFYSQALLTAKKLYKLNPSDEHIIIIIARTYIKLKRPKQALAVLTKAKANADKNLQAYYQSVEGDIYFELNDLPKAAQSYKNALKHQPLLAGALLGLGKYYVNIGKNDEAIIYIERAIRIRPKLTEGLYLLGQLYENKDKEKALKFYTIFHKKAANDPDFLELIPDIRKKIASLSEKSVSPSN